MKILHRTTLKWFISCSIRLKFIHYKLELYWTIYFIWVLNLPWLFFTLSLAVSILFSTVQFLQTTERSNFEWNSNYYRKNSCNYKKKLKYFSLRKISRLICFFLLSIIIFGNNVHSYTIHSTPDLVKNSVTHNVPNDHNNIFLKFNF